MFHKLIKLNLNITLHHQKKCQVHVWWFSNEFELTCDFSKINGIPESLMHVFTDFKIKNKYKF